MKRPILTLDLATHLGWACGSPADEPRFGSHRLPSTGDEIGRFLVAFEDWLCDMITVESPVIVVFEAPILTRGNTSPIVARKLMGLANATETICYRRETMCRQANLSTIKKGFAGHGRAEKADMIAAARRWGWDVKNDNEADALGVWFETVKHHAPDVFKRRFGMGPLQAAQGGRA
jgi:crossover junction endodeoxyribonuclease RuvC